MFEMLMEMDVPKDIVELLWKIYEDDNTNYKINDRIIHGIEN